MFTRLRRAMAAARAAYRQRLEPPPAPLPASGTAPGLITAGEAVKGTEVLETVTALPVSTWRYLWEPETVRHLGPMAQDWYAAFRLGGSDKRIDMVDGLGVTLVSIQALHRHVTQLQQEVDVCRAQLRKVTPPPPAPADK